MSEQRHDPHLLGVSSEALGVLRDNDVIDLHIDSFIWSRLFGYDLNRWHGNTPLRGRLLGHADFPRAIAAGLAGAVWIITTNPLRSPKSRLNAVVRNLEGLSDYVKHSPHQVALACTVDDFRRNRARGEHSVFVGIQGGNALTDDLSVLFEPIAQPISLVTLVHLTSSCVGATSSPLSGNSARGLSARGFQLLEALAEARVLADLAHLNESGFWDAVRFYDSSVPLIVSHTGASGVYPHWRNITDTQIKAIASRGGVVGIMLHAPFLTPNPTSATSATVIRHIEHVIRVAGDDFVSLGSDWDGFILPPADLRDCLTLARLVQRMLDLGWSDVRMAKILGGNFLRVLASIRS